MSGRGWNLMRVSGRLVLMVLGISSQVLAQTTFTNPEIAVNLPGGTQMEMVWIEPGTFTMGTTEDQEQLLRDKGLWDNWFENEHPAHQVTIRKGFYLGKYEITQGQWEAVMGNYPGQVSWNDVQAFIQTLNEVAGEEVYRLPTEAEWEYACRAGTSALWSFGDDVGTKRENPWGLFDMHSNVWECVQDWWYREYTTEAQVDPTGPSSGSYRVIRGGSYLYTAQWARSATRNYDVPGHRRDDLGVRLVRMGPVTGTTQAPRFIPDDLTIGGWDAEHRIYVLNQDVSEPLEIVQSGLIVDGWGHKVIGGGIGSGIGIKIVGKNGVTVKNIAVENWDVGIHVESSTGAHLVENVCTNNFQGIRLDVSSDNELMGNTCSDSRREMYGSGIYLHDSHRNLVRDNEARNNYSFGIGLEAGSTGNRLEGNTISGGTYEGIALMNAAGNNITGNQSTGNTYGIVLASSSNGNVLTQNTVSDNLNWGIGIVQSNGNAVTQNTATGNFQGIRLNLSSDNQLVGNTCSDSRREMYGSGIILHESGRNLIRDNETRGNYSWGIILEAGSSDNRLESNTITGGTYEGISLSNAPENIITGNQSTGNTYGVQISSSSDGNVLTQNTVSNNLNWGIGIHLSNNNKVYNNNFIENTGHQAYVAEGSEGNLFFLPEYGGNFWSDHTEPNVDSDPRFIDTPYLFPDSQRDDRPWAVKDGWREPSSPLVFTAYSPVNLIVTDPLNRAVDRQQQSAIPGATYEERDLDSDGDLDDRVVIPRPLEGRYTVDVLTEEAPPADAVYTLTAEYDGRIRLLADHTSVPAPATFSRFLFDPLNTDSTPPEVTATISGTPGNNGWYTSDVTVSWATSDPESGIASSSGAEMTTLAGETASTTLTCSAVNSVGLSNSVSVTVKIDKTPPTITGSRQPAANINGWNNTAVTVNFTANDDLSGIASVSAPTSLTNEGVNQSVTGMATDRAGNSASATVGSINIDKTPPTIALNGANPMQLTRPTTYEEKATVSDNTDPAPVMTVNGNVNASTPGTYLLTYTATDRSGNTAAATRTVVVLNHLPVVTGATPSLAVVWPPNHQMANIAIRGVTDPDQDPVTITITGITQDEPVNGTGDGDTSPDGAVLNLSTVQVRAERAGSNKNPGNGRVYRISFTASDPFGGSSTGNVTVGVPHDQGKSKVCTDDGQKYNSVTGRLAGVLAKLVAVDEEGKVGSGNYPNPFNPSTTIAYDLPQALSVRLVVYNLMGQQVRVLVEQMQGAGGHEVIWDGRDESGQLVSGGVYLYRLEAGGEVSVRKMLFIR